MKPFAPDRIQRMARAAGARLEIGAPAQAIQPDQPAKEEPAAAPEPATSAPATLVLDPQVAAGLRESADMMTQQIRGALLAQGSAQDRLSEALSAAVERGLGSLTASAPRPTRWLFKVERDVRGLIETIEAEARWADDSAKNHLESTGWRSAAKTRSN